MILEQFCLDAPNSMRTIKHRWKREKWALLCCSYLIVVEYAYCNFFTLPPAGRQTPQERFTKLPPNLSQSGNHSSVFHWINLLWCKQFLAVFSGWFDYSNCRMIHDFWSFEVWINALLLCRKQWALVICIAGNKFRQRLGNWLKLSIIVVAHLTCLSHLLLLSAKRRRWRRTQHDTSTLK